MLFLSLKRTLLSITARSVAFTGDENALALPPSSSGRRAMCEKCDLVDMRIRQLRSFIGPGLDNLSLATMRAVIETMEAEKIALHPKSRK